MPLHINSSTIEHVFNKVTYDAQLDVLSVAIDHFKDHGQCQFNRMVDALLFMEILLTDRLVNYKIAFDDSLIMISVDSTSDR